MDKIVAGCPSCQAQFRVDVEFGGRTIRCPRCQNPMGVPLAPGAPLAAAAAYAAQPAQAPAGYGAPATQPAIPQTQAAYPTPQTAAPPMPAGLPPQAQATPPAPASSAPPHPVAPTRSGPPVLRSRSGPPVLRQASAGGAPGSAYAPDGGYGQVVERPRLTPERGHRDDRGGSRGRPTNRRGSYEPRGSGGGLNPAALWSVIGGGVLLLLIVLGFAFSGGDDTPRTGPGSDDSTGGSTGGASGGQPATNPEAAANVERQRAEFTKKWKAAASPADRQRVLERWAGTVAAMPQLKSDYLTRLNQYLQTSEARAGDDDDGRAQIAKQLTGLGVTLARASFADAATPAFTAALRLDPENERAMVGAGYRKFEIPDYNEDKPRTELNRHDQILWFADENDFFKDFKETWGDRWLSPEEYREAQTAFDGMLGELGARLDRFDANPFLFKAEKAKFRLLENDYFKPFDFDVVVAKPYAIMLQKGSQRSWELRKKERTDTLQAFWDHMRERYIKPFGLVSNTTDANQRPEPLGNPSPFAFISFRDLASYQAYLKSKGKNLPPGARAFYDGKIKMVLFYEGKTTDESTVKGKFEFSVVIHEGTHQVLDRFAPNGIMGTMGPSISSHWIQEGFPDFVSGYRRDARGKIIFEQINEARRRSIVDAKRGFSRGNDWVLFELPLLLAIRDIRFVLNFAIPTIQRALLNKRYRSPILMPRRWNSYCHSMFYAYAWSFTYWLNQRYPEQYRRYLKAEILGKGGPEVFCRIFGSNASLPDYDRRWFKANRIQRNWGSKVLPVLREQINKLQADATIQRLNREWIQWMKDGMK